MDQNKLRRLNEDCHRALTVILRRVKDPRIPEFLTVVRVSLSGDLSCCNIYVSTLGGLEETQKAIEGLKSASGFIRRELGKAMHTYKVADLRFFADTTMEHSARIEKLLDDLRPEERSK